jgi:hypothetical protein
VPRLAGVADARQHVGDRIGHVHVSVRSSPRRRFAPGSPGWRLPLMAAVALDGHRSFAASRYQLDLVTPGSWPSRARSRKQMRHIAKRRM